MGEAKRRAVLDPTFGQPKPNEMEISQFVLITHLAIATGFDVEKFQQRLLDTGEWLNDVENMGKMNQFLDRMVD